MHLHNKMINIEADAILRQTIYAYIKSSSAQKSLENMHSQMVHEQTEIA